jgi:hypothetical protein
LTFLLESLLELGVDLGQPEIDYHASSGLGIVEEVSRLDISMVNAEVF